MAKIPTLKPTMPTVSNRIVHVPEVISPRAPKRTLDLYGSAAWKAIRLQVQREARRTCQSCGKTDTRIYVDHIIEIRDGGAPLDRANLQALCGGCHARKTARVRANRQAAAQSNA